MQVKINFAPSAPSLQAQHIARLIDLFLSEQEQRRKPETARCNRYRFNRFLAWWEEEGPARSWLLDEAALYAFAKWLGSCESERGGKLGWHSRHDTLRRLRQLFRWAHQRGYVPLDLSGLVPLPKGAPNPRQPVDLDLLERMIQACDQTNEPERNRAILAVLAGTGVRSEECATLRAENVTTYEDFTGYIRLSKAKGDKPRIVAFDAATGRAIQAWRAQLPYACGPLFPSRTGRKREPQPLTANSLYKTLVRIAKLAGVNDRFRGGHDMRRCFATLWARAGAPVDLLQTQLGHRHASTTMIYILNDAANVREALAQRPISPFAQVQAEAAD